MEQTIGELLDDNHCDDNYFCSINSGLPIINGCWLQEEVHIIIMLDVLYYYYNCHDHRHNNHFQLELMHSWGLTETHLAKAKHISDNYLKAHCLKYQLHWRQHSMLPVLHSWLIARRKICWGSWGRSLGWRTRSAWLFAFILIIIIIDTRWSWRFWSTTTVGEPMGRPARRTLSRRNLKCLFRWGNDLIGS